MYTVAQFVDRFSEYGVKYEAGSIVVNGSRIPAQPNDTFSFGANSAWTNGRGRSFYRDEYILGDYVIEVARAERDADGPMYRTDTPGGVHFAAPSIETDVTFEVKKS